jgi:phosphate transport system substrate-binding protein
MLRIAQGCFLLAFIVVSTIGCGGNKPAESSGGESTSKKSSDERVTLSGGGATFVSPAMQEWASKYRKLTKDSVRIDYQAKGSGNGIQQFTKQAYIFGCSDAPMNKEQLKQATDAGGEVIHLPITIGAVVLAYNLEGVVEPLTLTGDVLVDIYLGKIKKWNDAKLTALNPSAKLPDLEIIPVYRSDSSGTTNIFTEYLSKVSPEFKSTVGASTSPKWPDKIGIGQNKNDGIAGHIKRSPGAIGYVELTYALEGKLPFAKVVNAAGKPILASLESITLAAEASLATKPTEEPYSLHQLTYSLTNAAGDGSYPISGISYAMLFKKQTTAEGKALVEFFKWVISDGQPLAKALNYAPVPESLAKKILARLDEVELVGK